MTLQDKATDMQEKHEVWLKGLTPEEWINLGEEHSEITHKRGVEGLPFCEDDFNDFLMWHFAEQVYPVLKRKKVKK